MKHSIAKKFSLFSFTVFSIGLATISQTYAQIAPISTEEIQAKPVEFQHNDWQLVCDNTRTCRAVGYQDENIEDNKSVALMLKRNAGANQRVRAYVMFGDQFADTMQMTCGDKQGISLSINDKSYGKVTKVSNTESQSGDAWELTTQQTHALINTLPISSKVEFTVGCDKYVVSGKGSTAALLKMDETQGRVGTKGAIVQRNQPFKHKRLESSVLSAIPVPIVKAVKVDDEVIKRDSDTALFLNLQEKMTGLVLPTMSEETKEYCDAVSREDSEDWYGEKKWKFYRLNDNKILAEHKCWMGAYNVGYGYWLINDIRPYSPKFITDMGSNYDNGEISAVQRGRGYGDCYSYSEWQWVKTADGQAFVQTEKSSTGLCRSIAAGGAFTLPTVVTEVIESH